MEKTPLQKVIELSGLPQDGATDFLSEAFAARGVLFENAGLEDLRGLLAEMLQDLILQSEEH